MSVITSSVPAISSYLQRFDDISSDLNISAISNIMKQGHTLVKGPGLVDLFCGWLTLLLWCFHMCCLRLLFLDTAGDELCQQILASSFLKFALVGKW